MLNEQDVEFKELNEKAIDRVTGGEEPFRETIQLIVPDVVNEKGKTLAGMIGGN